MITLLEIHQKFLISLRTEKRGGYDPWYTEIKALKCLGKVLDDRLVEGWITNNAPLANQSFSYLKLRLNKTDDVPVAFHKFQNRRDHNFE